MAVGSWFGLEPVINHDINTADNSSNNNNIDHFYRARGDSGKLCDVPEVI